MPKVEGLSRLVEKLRAKAAAVLTSSKVSVVVGYNSAYALYAHEEPDPVTLHQNVPRPSGIGVFWGPPQYGPKFLEGPAREYGPVLGEITRNAMRQGKTLAQGLLLAGLRLQRESQARVPREYANLFGSAFTQLEDHTP